MKSLLLEPLSGVMEVITGCCGATVSTVMVSAVPSALVLPAASVAVALKVWLPSVSVPVLVRLHTP